MEAKTGKTFSDISEKVIAEVKVVGQRLMHNLEKAAREEGQRRDLRNEAEKDLQELIEKIHVFVKARVGKSGVKDEHIRAWIRNLGSDDFGEREEASRALLQDAGFRAKPALEVALKSRDLETARRAKAILKTLAWAESVSEHLSNLKRKQSGVKSREAVSPLLKLLESAKDDHHIRVYTIFALEDIGPAAKEAIPALIDIIKDKNTDIGYHAVRALGRVGPGDEMAVSALIDAVQDERPNIRNFAIPALGAMGSEAKEAVPVLIKTLKHKIPFVRDTAAEALGKIGAAAVPALKEALEDKEGRVRILAAITLARIEGPRAIGVIDILIKALKDKNENGATMFDVTKVLKNMGSAAKTAVPALINVASDKKIHWGTVENAIEALAAIGLEAKSALPVLKALKDSVPDEAEIERWGTWAASDVRKTAATAIKAIEKASVKQSQNPPVEVPKDIPAIPAGKKQRG